MQIVFAHYHLNPGGVTQVIANQISALATLPQEKRPERVGIPIRWAKRWLVRGPMEETTSI